MDGPLTSLELQPAPAEDSVFAHGCFLFRRFVAFLLVLCGLSVAAWWVAKTQSGPIIRHLLLDKLRSHYEPLGIVPRVGDVVFTEGRGIALRDISFHDRSDKGPILVEVDELLIRSDARLIDILWEGFRPQRVFVRRLHARVERDSDGQLTIQRLLPLPQLGNRKVPIVLEEAQADLSLQIGSWQFHEQLTNLNLQITPKVVPAMPSGSAAVSPQVAGWQYEVEGHLQGNQVGELNFQGAYRDTDQRWQLTGSTSNLHVTTEMIRLSSELAGQDVSEMARADARLNLRFAAASQGLDWQNLDYRVTGNVEDGRVEDRRLPYPIVDVIGRFDLTPDAWVLSQVEARSGTGVIHLAGSRRLEGEQEQYHVELGLSNVTLNQRLAEYLPPDLRKIWNEFLPVGNVSAQIQVDGRPGAWQPNVELDLDRVEVTFHLFPYPVRQCIGRLVWSPDKLLVNLDGQVSGSPVSVHVDLDNPGPAHTGSVKIDLHEPVPVGEELFQALRRMPQLASVIRDFHPSGKLGATALFRRDEPYTKTQPYITIELQDGTVAYRHFPYPLSGIQGQIVVNDEWTYFQDLSGRNDAGHVTCEGSFSPQQYLELTFVATSVPLEEELRAAMPPDFGQFWNRLRPQGDLDHVTIELQHDFQRQDMKLRVEGQMWPHTDADTASVSIRPEWLPYQWNHLSGSFVYNDGEIKLHNIRGVHRDTLLNLQGTGRAYRDGWWLDLEPFSIDRLKPTNDFLAALPEAMSASIHQLDLDGQINVMGRLVLQSGLRDVQLNTPLQRTEPDPEDVLPPLEVQWDMACDLERGSLDVATERLHDIHGSAKLMGGMIDDRVFCWGELQVDSAMIWDAQAMQVRGPFFLDNERLAFGSLAPTLDPARPARPIRAQFLEGELNVDAEVRLTRDAPFRLQATLKDARLEAFADEISPQMQSLSGLAYVGLDLRGTAQGTHTLNGDGYIRLRHARLYEFPLMLNMLKILSVRQVDRTAFNTSNIDFRLQGDRFLLDRVEFIGDAISLKGVGEVDLNRRVQAQFYSTVGRDELFIPVISPLFGAASRQILVINVEGTLDKPTVTQVPFPLINDALQAIISEQPISEPRIIPGVPTATEMFDSALGPEWR